MSTQWVDEFRRNGAGAGVARLLQMYFQETASAGASGTSGPIVDRNMFTSNVLVPLLVTYTGLLLNTRQKGSLKACFALMSIPHVPASMPMTSAEFILRFKTATQMFARRGQMTTKVGSVMSSYQDVKLTLERYVAGFTIGDQEFLLERNPDEVIAALVEKMESLETTWRLTMLNMHAKYAAAQPTITQRMLANGVLHQPPNNLMARMMQICYTEHIACGAFNRSLDNMASALTSFAELIAPKCSAIVCLVSQTVLSCGRLELTKERVHITHDHITYNTRKMEGMGGYAVFGVVDKGPESSWVKRYYADGNEAHGVTVTGIKTNADTLAAVGPESTEDGDSVFVDVLKLPNGVKCFMIGVDATPFDATPDSDSCDKPLRSKGVKKTFFTVGACPDAYGAHVNGGYFNQLNAAGGVGVCGITPKTVSDASPGTSYVYDYSRNKVAKVTLAQLHAQVATTSLFNANDMYTAWKRVFSEEHLGYVNEEDTADLLCETREQRSRSSLLMFETNPRGMFIVTPGHIGVAGAGCNYNRGAAGGNNLTCVSLVGRGVLGNASPCSEFANEMVGSVGSLMHILSGSLGGLKELLEFMVKELSLVTNPANVIAFRNDYGAVAAVNFANVDQVTRMIQQIVSGNGLLSDPECQVAFVKLYEYATNLENYNNAQPGTPLFVLHSLVNDYLAELKARYDMILNARADISGCVSTIFANPEYNVATSAPYAIVEHVPRAVVTGWESYLKFMYNVAMPALTTQLLIRANAAPRGSAFAVGGRFGNVGQMPQGVFVAPGAPVPANYQVVYPYTASAGEITLARPLFRKRHELVMRNFAASPLVKVMAMMHWWTAWNEDTMTNHFDQLYYSGQSYIVVRTIQFQGYGVSAVPLKSMRLLMGNRAAAYPTTSWTLTEYKQTMELATAPVDQCSVGVSCPNVYMDNIRGAGVVFDVHNPECCLVFDSYNSFLPEGMGVYQPELGMISIHGRYDDCVDLNDIDRVSGIYTQLPTGFFKTSHIFQTVKQALNDHFDEDSSVGIMDNALSLSSFPESIPAHVQSAIVNGLAQADFVKQIVGDDYRNFSIFTDTFGGIFTDDFSVGAGSSALLRGDRLSASLNSELQPRISSMGGLVPNSIFGQTSLDSKFMLAFQRQVSMARTCMATTNY